jgi:DNA-binding HxlR family transcriptional regulator
MTRETRLLQIAQELSGRWTIPILLNLPEKGGRFTPLQHALDISPSRLSDNLRKMEEAGIVQHLSPYERRHPLLPEYRLTDKGLLLREAARAVQSSEKEIGAGPLHEKSWNWPILLAIHQQYNRFQAIRRALLTPTPRILSLRMTELGDIGLIRKELTEEPRPGYLYLLENSARPPVRQLHGNLLSLL